MNWFSELPEWAQVCLIAAAVAVVSVTWVLLVCWVIAQAIVGGVQSGVEAAKQKKK